MLDALPLTLPDRRSASDLIAQTLREAIVSGHLDAGVVLRQDNLAARFSVSKIPVREALKRLEAEGLVSFIRNRGAVVAALSPAEIWEYFEIRALLEAHAAALAAPQISAANLALAADAIARFGSETAPGAWATLNWQIHSALYADAGKPVLLGEIRALYDKVERYVRALLSVTPEHPKTQREHLAILDAFHRHDAPLAAELTRRHVLDGGATLVRYLNDHHRADPAARTGVTA